MSTRSRLISLAVLATAAAAPGAAQAATTCSYNSFNHLATVTTFASGDVASVARSGSAIQVNGVACGAATVTNTDLIEVSDASGGDSTLALDLSGGPLAPGFTAQFGDPSPTIKITYDGNDGNDTFEVFGSSQDDTIHLGASHVNLDVAADQNHADADVDLSEVETADINGGGGSDVIDATAHLDTGAAFSGMLYLEGALGDDTLTSGSGPGEISGGAGNDTLSVGGVGQTLIKPGIGDDVATGELLAADVVDYGDAPAGVHVDLKRINVQGTGGAGNDQLSGFHRLNGSPYDDVLAGTEGADVIQGGGGNDVLMGRNGDDKLVGGAGVNTVSYAEPSPGANTGVTVSLATQGVAQDTGTEGKDTLSGISGVIGSPFADTITGDGAANTIDAGDGPDTLFVRDGISDHADCGAGTDSVQSDVAGLDVLTGCEQVDFAPSADPGQPGGGPTGPGATADTTLTFRFTAKTRQRLGKHGIVKGSLLCPDEACTGEVSSKLTIGRIARRAAHKTTLVAAGRAKVVGLKLSARNLRRVRAALRHGTRVSLKITAIAHDAAGNRRTVTRTIRLRP
ncbi:MAG: calcium-binding protein [Actinobacteria bacterium]|nr:MAG: calcium-binding protein [Actinomycetota bacterium]